MKGSDPGDRINTRGVDTSVDSKVVARSKGGASMKLGPRWVRTYAWVCGWVWVGRVCGWGAVDIACVRGRRIVRRTGTHAPRDT